MITVTVFGAKDYVVKMFEKANRNFNFDLKFYDVTINPATAKLAEGSDAICVFVNDFITKGVVSSLKNIGCKLIALRCAGYNNVDLDATKEAGIPVVRVPEYSPFAIAEHALAMILTLNRKTHKAYNRVRDLNFSLDGLLGFDLHKKTIGVIGTGKIGQTFIKTISGFEMNVLAYDPFPNEEAAKKLNFKYVDLDTLYKNSDIISLHCPLVPQNHHMINAESIKKMKDYVMIINTSRGGLVDTKAIVDGLKDYKIGAFGADVYEEEDEYFFEDLSNVLGIEDDILARLLTFNNVLVTAHQAFFTQEALDNIAQTTLGNIKNFIENNELKNLVTQ